MGSLDRPPEDRTKGKKKLLRFGRAEEITPEKGGKNRSESIANKKRKSCCVAQKKERTQSAGRKRSVTRTPALGGRRIYRRNGHQNREKGQLNRAGRVRLAVNKNKSIELHQLDKHKKGGRKTGMIRLSIEKKGVEKEKDAA